LANRKSASLIFLNGFMRRGVTCSCDWDLCDLPQVAGI
jgi:hypothetical protein